MNAQRSHLRTLPRFSRLRRLALAEDGAAAAEYALLLAVLGTAVLVAMLRLSGAVSGSIDANATVVAAAESGATPAPGRSFGGTQVNVVPPTSDPWPEEERTNERAPAGESIG